MSPELQTALMRGDRKVRQPLKVALITTALGGAFHTLVGLTTAFAISGGHVSDMSYTFAPLLGFSLAAIVGFQIKDAPTARKQMKNNVGYVAITSIASALMGFALGAESGSRFRYEEAKAARDAAVQVCTDKGMEAVRDLNTREIICAPKLAK